MDNVLTVSEINNYIKNRLEGDIILQDIWLVGELTNVKFYQQGAQYYLTLSDGEAQINAVIYSSVLEKISFEIKNGLKIAARGKIKVFHKKGNFIFQIFYLLEQGDGLKAKVFEKLKAKLLKEGLFDPARKKPIPKYPKNIALVTAYDSAAMWDFVTISQKIAPNLKIIIIPAIMQGENSKSSLINALDLAFKNQKKIDLLAIIRGGGANEDLASFNEEDLVRKIATMPMPLISAIGHEIDYTLTDFVVDLRLPTPTACAHYICQPYLDLKLMLDDQIPLLAQKIKQKIKQKKETIDQNMQQIRNWIQLQYKQKKVLFDQFIIRLEQANPLHKMRQGYSITRDFNTKKIIRSIKNLELNQTILTDLQDGQIVSKIIKEKI